MIYIQRLCIISKDLCKHSCMHVYDMVVWWMIQMKLDGRPDLLRFRSVDWIVYVGDDRIVYWRQSYTHQIKLDSSATQVALIGPIWQCLVSILDSRTRLSRKKFRMHGVLN